MTNAAFINALREEGSKQDCLEQVVRLFNKSCELRKQLVKAGDRLKEIETYCGKIGASNDAIRAGNLAHAARIELGLTDKTQPSCTESLGKPGLGAGGVGEARFVPRSPTAITDEMQTPPGITRSARGEHGDRGDDPMPRGVTVPTDLSDEQGTSNG